MARFLLFLLGGLVGAGIAVAVVATAKTSPERGARNTPSDRVVLTPDQVKGSDDYRELLAQRDEMADQVTELTGELETTRKDLEKARELAAPEPEKMKIEIELGPPTEQEVLAALTKFAGSLQASILGDDKSAFEEWRAFAKRGGKELIDRLIAEVNDDEMGFQRRVIRAHALAQTLDPRALEALSKPLKDPDATMLELRSSSHALAFAGTDAVVPILEQTARHCSDIGARANAAFGLARRGREEGYVLYMDATDAAFEKKDPAAIQYLSGFFLLGEKAYPYVRERLRTYTDPQAKLFLIEILKGKNDTGAIPHLKSLLEDPNQDEGTRKAAEAAIRVLEPKAN
jgi:hypothetical protein